MVGTIEEAREKAAQLVQGGLSLALAAHGRHARAAGPRDRGRRDRAARSPGLPRHPAGARAAHHAARDGRPDGSPRRQLDGARRLLGPGRGLGRPGLGPRRLGRRRGGDRRRGGRAREGEGRGGDEERGRRHARRDSRPAGARSGHGSRSRAGRPRPERAASRPDGREVNVAHALVSQEARVRFRTPDNAPWPNPIRRTARGHELRFSPVRARGLKEFLSVLEIMREFIRGFRTLHFVGPCVTVFGSARFKENHPYYALTEKVGRRPREARLHGDDGRRPRGHGGGVPRRQGRRRLHRGVQHRPARGAEAQSLRGPIGLLRALLRPQGHARQVLLRLRRDAGRPRHDGRALRGADAHPDGEDRELSGRAHEHRVLPAR